MAPWQHWQLLTRRGVRAQCNIVIRGHSIIDRIVTLDTRTPKFNPSEAAAWWQRSEIARVVTKKRVLSSCRVRSRLVRRRVRISCVDGCFTPAPPPARPYFRDYFLITVWIHIRQFPLQLHYLHLIMLLPSLPHCVKQASTAVSAAWTFATVKSKFNDCRFIVVTVVKENNIYWCLCPPLGDIILVRG